MRQNSPCIPQGVFCKQKTVEINGFLLARVAGFEPAHDGIRIHCLTTWRYPNIEMGWVVGFEPTHTGATTLGLNRLTIPTISILKVGDRERARTVDLQRDRLAF